MRCWRKTLIRRKKRITRTTSRSKVCNFCGTPYVLTETRDRSLYDFYVKKSKIWKAIREWALERAGNRCQECGKFGLLEVHHCNYNRLGHEWPIDLIVLCSGCHSKKHLDK